MRSIQSEKSRAQAEALFTIRERQKVDAPVAIREYKRAQQELLTNMERLRRLREATKQKRR